MRILFLCTGNTCRSPMAEGIMKKLLLEHNRNDICCDSAGTSTLDGLQASEHSIEVCREIGINLSDHLSKSIQSMQLNNFDWIVTLTSRHTDVLIKLGISKDKIYTLKDVSDPFGLSIDSYRNCRNDIQKQIENFYKEKICV